MSPGAEPSELGHELDGASLAHLRGRLEEREHRRIFEKSTGIEGRSISLIVEVELADGRVGTGEATLFPHWSGEAPRASLALLEDVIRPAVVGRSVDEVADVIRAR